MKGALTHTLRVCRASCGAKKQRKKYNLHKIRKESAAK